MPTVTFQTKDFTLPQNSEFKFPEWDHWEIEDIADDKLLIMSSRNGQWEFNYFTVLDNGSLYIPQQKAIYSGPWRGIIGGADYKIGIKSISIIESSIGIFESSDDTDALLEYLKARALKGLVLYCYCFGTGVKLANIHKLSDITSKFRLEVNKIGKETIRQPGEKQIIGEIESLINKIGYKPIVVDLSHDEPTETVKKIELQNLQTPITVKSLSKSDIEKLKTLSIDEDIYAPFAESAIKTSHDACFVASRETEIANLPKQFISFQDYLYELVRIHNREKRHGMDGITTEQLEMHLDNWINKT